MRPPRRDPHDEVRRHFTDRGFRGWRDRRHQRLLLPHPSPVILVEFDHHAGSRSTTISRRATTSTRSSARRTATTTAATSCVSTTSGSTTRAALTIRAGEPRVLLLALRPRVHDAHGDARRAPRLRPRASPTPGQRDGPVGRARHRRRAHRAGESGGLRHEPDLAPSASHRVRGGVAGSASGGRFILGLGTGHSAAVSAGARPSAPSAFKDGVAFTRALLRGRARDTERCHHRVAPTAAACRLRRRLGARRAAAAGAAADGVFINYGLQPEHVTRARTGVADGARRRRPRRGRPRRV